MTANKKESQVPVQAPPSKSKATPSTNGNCPCKCCNCTHCTCNADPSMKKDKRPLCAVSKPQPAKTTKSNTTNIAATTVLAFYQHNFVPRVVLK